MLKSDINSNTIKRVQRKLVRQGVSASLMMEASAPPEEGMMVSGWQTDEGHIGNKQKSLRTQL